MPPASRGWMFLRVTRRHASTTPPLKPTTKSPSTKLPTNNKPPSYPSRPEQSVLRPRNVKAQAPKPEAEATPQSRNSLLHNLSKDPKYRHWRRFFFAIPGFILVGMHFPYLMLPVTGESMSPYFNSNPSNDEPTKSDTIIVRRHLSSSESKRRTREELGPDKEDRSEFSRGQILTFDAPHDPHKILVKRVVGIPGDVVHPRPGYPGGDAPVVVQWNHLWVEGDNGGHKQSQDSNTYGPISQNLISGEVIAIWNSWFKFDWIDWKKDMWPARSEGRVEENAIMQAMVNPDDVDYSMGWKNGRFALDLEQMKQRPDRALFQFVNDPKIRQSIRRLYNNALYVQDVAAPGPEKELAIEMADEMENIYGREALVFGIRMKIQPRDRGELPDNANSKIGERAIKDKDASEAEKWLKKQGWQLERNTDGTVKTQPSS